MNSSDLPMWHPFLGPSQRLLQPLWDHLLLQHRPLLASPFFPVLLAFSSYVLFSLPFTALDLLGGQPGALLQKYKIQPDQRPTPGMMARSFRMAVYNHLVFVLPAVSVGSLVLTPPSLPPLAPTLYEVLVDGLAVLLLFDTQYYIWHYVHHKHPQLYSCVHAVHHRNAAPFSWSTEQLSVFELMTVGLWSNQDPVLLRCHPLTTWAVTVFSIWLSVEDHIGYDLPWALSRLMPLGLLGGAPAHDMHHQRPSSNYAPFFSHWDRIFGTAAAPERNGKKNTVTHAKERL